MDKKGLGRMRSRTLSEFRRLQYARAALELLEPRVMLSGATVQSFGGGDVVNVSGQASTLSFQIVPTTINAGRTGPIVVDVNGPGGGIDKTSSADITLTIYSGADRTSVATMVTVEAENGAAVFSNLSLPSPGTYALLATYGSLAVTGSMTVSPDSATHLAFIAQPTDGLVGKTMGTIQIAVEDAFGNVVASDQPAITLGVNPDPGAIFSDVSVADQSQNVHPASTILIGTGGGVALQGTVTVNAQNGIATFDHVYLPAIGVYSMYATAGSLQIATAAPLTIRSTATHLVISYQPVSRRAGSSEGVNVLLEDDQGAIVTGDTSDVTLTLADASGNTGNVTLLSNTSTPTLQGTTTIRASDGSASFGDLSFMRTGDFTLVATDGTLPAVTSSVFTITPQATHLVFLNPPTGGVPGTALDPIRVAVEDDFGNVVTDWGAAINLLAEPTGVPIGGYSVLRGGTEAEPVEGIATFSNVNFPDAGTYAIKAEGDISLTVATVDNVIIKQEVTSGGPILPDPTPVTPIAPPSLLAPPVTLVANLGGMVGAASLGSLVADASGNLFGETTAGGVNDNGSIFEIVAGSGTARTVVSFEGTKGYSPSGGLLMDAAGNIYGTTTAGGANGDGSIFMLPQGGQNVVTLADFSAATGSVPLGTLVMDLKGNLFGMNSHGGANGTGTIFELAKGGRAVQPLVSFARTSSTEPGAGLTLDTRGNLYGMTLESGNGTIFELMKGNRFLKTVAVMDSTMTGFSWGSMVLDAQGDLFGTLEGSAGIGGVFEVVKGGRKARMIAHISSAIGIPEGGLLIDKWGTLFGTFTAIQNSSDFGGIFSVASGSGTITLIAACDGSTTGKYAVGKLTSGPQGTLYGTTYAGGSNDAGTVFSFSPPLIVPLPVKVVIQQQPVVKSGVVSLRVVLADAKGKVMKAGSFGVTLSLAAGPAGAVFSPVTVESVNGVVVFTGVKLPLVAGRYTFDVTEGTLAPVVTRTLVVRVGVGR